MLKCFTRKSFVKNNNIFNILQQQVSSCLLVFSFNHNYTSLIYGVPYGQTKIFFSPFNAMHDGTIVKSRWYDGTMVKTRCNIAVSSSYYCCFTFVPSWFHNRAIVVSSSCHRCFTIVPSLFHHRTIAFR